MDDYVKVYLAPRETGYARVITEDIVMIDNMPLHGDLHYGDIVRLEPADGGIRLVDALLVRRYPNMMCIKYQTLRQFHLFSFVCQIQGAKVEGLTGPGAQADGECIVAFDADRLDPVKLAEAIGIKPHGVF